MKGERPVDDGRAGVDDLHRAPLDRWFARPAPARQLVSALSPSMRPRRRSVRLTEIRWATRIKDHHGEIGIRIRELGWILARFACPGRSRAQRSGSPRKRRRWLRAVRPLLRIGMSLTLTPRLNQIG